MPVKTEWIRYGEHLGYLARPDRAAGPLPAVIVIQEIWGVDVHIEDVTRRIAAAGYAALAPDLFAADGVRPPALSAERIAVLQAFMSALPPGAWANPAVFDAELAKQPEPGRTQIGETRKTLFSNLERRERFVAPLTAAAQHLRRERDLAQAQKVACVGFCMGGGLSALLACENPELAGAAVYYGASPPAEQIPRIACPIVGFYGGLDERVNSGVPAFAEAMRAAGKSFEYWTYEGALHGFFNDTRPSYNVKAARDSFARFLEFLRRTIGT
jgi:carboxymethylenebutenolidase